MKQHEVGEGEGTGNKGLKSLVVMAAIVAGGVLLLYGTLVLVVNF